MENCILGSGASLFDKIATVSADQNLYEHIRRQGHDLIHQRYGYHQWTWIRDWLHCYQTLGVGDKVQQQGLFGGFRAVPQSPQTPALFASLPDNDYAHHVREASALLLDDGDINKALDYAVEITKWTGHASEPWVIMAVISLLRRGLEQAKSMLLAVRDIRKDNGLEICLDPEEIALLMLVALLQGDNTYLNDMNTLAASINHISLRRISWLIQKSAGQDAKNIDLDRRLSTDRLSIHLSLIHI